MTNKTVFIYGAGGHGKVVLETLLAQQEGSAGIVIGGWLDDDVARHGEEFFGYPIKGGRTFLAGANPRDVAVVVAIGDNRLRADVVRSFQKMSIPFFTVIHPSAIISRSATVGEGSMIITRAIIHPSARVGAHTIINTNATVEHDDIVGSFCHIAPHAILGSHVRVGDFADVFTNATVKLKTTIGNYCVIGAGAVVLRDVPDYVTVVGNPARILEKKLK